MQHSKTQQGGTVVGFILGLVIGLAIAVAVAFVITKAPVPFINKLAHTPDKPDVDAGNLPDPNKSLYGRDAQNASSSAPVLGNVPGGSANPVLPPVTNAPVVVTPSPSSVVAPAPSVPEGKPTMLQVGAFKSTDEAENMKAKLALLGLEAIVAPTTKDGNAFYRVRLGPYARIDDINRVRQSLAENGIDASLVPLGK